jgi:hypothetical protein
MQHLLEALKQSHISIGTVKAQLLKLCWIYSKRSRVCQNLLPTPKRSRQQFESAALKVPHC